MKKIFKIGILLSFIAVVFHISAESNSRGKYGSTPMEVLDTVVGEANKDIQFQETALDGINANEGGYQSHYKISNTLDYLRANMAPYIQWMVYIGLVLSVILVVYNGFLMVTHTINKSGDFGKVKKNIGFIATGVILLTGFYAIIKLVVGIINMVFGTNGSGDTGF